MCGRFLLESEVEDLVARYNAEYSLDVYKSGEIFPSENPITVVSENNENVLKVMKWGFPMRGSKRLIINARSETALEKPMFKSPLLQRRCIIPANAFFEWKGDKGKKIKHRISKNHVDIFSMAGIYNIFKDENNAYEAFTILTLNATGAMESIHDRMPLILDREEEKLWLDHKSAITFVESILKNPRAIDFAIKPLDLKSEYNLFDYLNDN